MEKDQSLLGLVSKVLKVVNFKINGVQDTEVRKKSTLGHTPTLIHNANSLEEKKGTSHP